MGLSLFRAAAILAGVGARAAQGNASSRIAAEVGGWVGEWVGGWARQGKTVLLLPGNRKQAACWRGCALLSATAAEP
jgi:hypothetical protein